MSLGNLGDVRPIGSGVSELRIDCGPGYRVYFAHRGLGSVVLLTGRTKATQSRDIKQAIAMANNFQDIQ
jgi:putative addiction module killer protein